ncbi:MAG: DUF4249 domain-containing protein [Bacteroidota bacterium]
MKSLIYSLLLLGVLFGSTACEEIIELELSDSEPQLVIEGTITDLAAVPARVQLTYSGSYFEPGDYAFAEGATVSIRNSQGEQTQLAEVAPGIYQSNEILGALGEAYTLEIEADGQSYQTTSSIQPSVPLDSVSFVVQNGGPIEGIFPRVHFQDPAGEDTYLRFVVFVNGQPRSNILIYDDNLSDGANAISPLVVLGLQPGDELLIQAWSLDRAGYDYYFTLSNIVGDAFGAGGQSAAPSNPTSNIEGKAVGYFGAHAVSSISVVVP